ncbi:glycosyltransferase family 39 protein [Sinorhizobium numidicum]|uniref:Glycosyltransferase family 39 protein n=1 Tax=Sinorhizobium numidicum TaxID=680248 RepID=A0ABY8CRH6_9HYPH|nr:glycosyltransferase family 39 protein [Sinorhizobium numidicum]WEX75266.1 glycosyltransferase family 39 protein [Sinorhizobium numidicum]WEX81261.1 glycosyltransferase family 39 protein [Sinorhizobium numidicum]
MYYDASVNSDGRSNRVGFDRQYLIFATLASLLSVALFLFNTRHGIGIYPDTARYMGITEQPYDAPLYAWLLQFPASLGFEMAKAAKAFGLSVACANTLLIWHLLTSATRKQHYAVFGTTVIILAPQFVTQHSLAMSEPLFLFLLLLVLLCVLRYFRNARRVWLIASAVALGSAALTRFTAPPMGAAIVASILLNPRHGVARRITDAAIYGIVSASIFLTWSVISHLQKGHSIGRELWFYGNMGTSEWLSSLGALAAWLLPDDFPFAVRVLALCAFAIASTGLILVHAYRTLHSARTMNVAYGFLPIILGLFFLFYMGFMVLATSIEANLSLNGRYAFPAYVMTVIAITITLAEFRDSGGLLKTAHHGLVVLAVVVLCSHTVRTVVRSADAYRSGIGYASLEWTNSPTMAAVNDLPANALIYSNGPDAIAYVLRRPARYIPEHFKLRTGNEDPSNPFEKQIGDLLRASTGQPAYLVMFDRITWRFYRASEAELKQLLSLATVATAPDGRVYRILPTSSPG